MQRDIGRLAALLTALLALACSGDDPGKAYRVNGGGAAGGGTTSKGGTGVAGNASGGVNVGGAATGGTGRGGTATGGTVACVRDDSPCSHDSDCCSGTCFNDGYCGIP